MEVIEKNSPNVFGAPNLLPDSSKTSLQETNKKETEPGLNLAHNQNGTSATDHDVSASNAPSSCDPLHCPNNSGNINVDSRSIGENTNKEVRLHLNVIFASHSERLESFC